MELVLNVTYVAYVLGILVLKPSHVHNVLVDDKTTCLAYLATSRYLEYLYQEEWLQWLMQFSIEDINTYLYARRA